MILQYFNNKNKETLMKRGAIWLSLLVMFIFCMSLIFDDFKMPQKTISINIDLQDKITSDISKVKNAD